MRFTFRQLEYFIAAGETGSIALASERLSISPSSISTAISSLEQELSTQLFLRIHAQGLSLTSVGRLMLKKAKGVIEEAELLRGVIAEAGEQLHGRLAVGYLKLLAPMIMPEVSGLLRREFPDVQVGHIECEHQYLMESLQRHRLDMALTYDLNMPEGVIFTPLANLPIHALVGEAHPMSKRSQVDLCELYEQPFVLLDIPEIRDYQLSLFGSVGFTPNVRMRSACVNVVRSVVADGNAYTLANERPRNNRTMDGRQLVRLELRGGLRSLRAGIARPAKQPGSPLVDAVAARCSELISDSYIPGMEAPRKYMPASVTGTRMSSHHVEDYQSRPGTSLSIPH
jgi:DNA-binding transcriptional LysR family regulator